MLKETDIYRLFITKKRIFMGNLTGKRYVASIKISITIFAVKSLKCPLKSKNCLYFSYICRYVNLYLYISLKVLTN